MDIEFDTNESRLSRAFQGRRYEAQAETVLTIVWDDPHSESPPMRVGRKEVPSDVTPSDHLAFRKRHETRVTVPDGL